MDCAGAPGAGSSYERIALVLQGGGALGAYQVGVYQALEEAGYAPDWFVGTSIGGINAAILAGSPPGERIERLEAFWAAIRRPEVWPAPPADSALRPYANQWSAWQTLMLGQPGFFDWRPVPPQLAAPGSPGALSYYDTGALRATLVDLIDLDQVNRGPARLSLGAAHVESGEQVYFDSRDRAIGLDHVMACAALPPAFAPVLVEGEWYWDGGIVSNTPLHAVIDDMPRVSSLVFMVDLFDPRGAQPRTIDEVNERHKDIVYASRSNRDLERHRTNHNLRRAVDALWRRLPEAAHADRHLRALAGLGCTTTMHVVHLLRRSAAHETSAKDYEFSATSIRERRAAGYRDARRRLEAPAWLEPVPPDVGVVIHEPPEAPAG